MTEFPEGRSFRASSISSSNPIDDWSASADDPFLASSSAVLPNGMESRTSYSPLSMGRKEFQYVGRSSHTSEHEQPHEAQDETWSRFHQPSISQPSTHQQQLGLHRESAPPSSHAAIKRPLSSSSNSVGDIASDSGPPLNATDLSRFFSATKPEPLALLHGAYLSHIPAAREQRKYQPELSEPLTVWGRPEDSEPTLLDLVSRYPLRQEVTVENGVRVVLYFCGVLQCNNANGFSSETELRKHQRSHIPAEKRPHICGIDGCTMRFLYLAYRIRHQEEAHFNVQHYCSECALSCKSRSSLRRHVKQNHPFARRPTYEAARSRLAAVPSSSTGPCIVLQHKPEIGDGTDVARDEHASQEAPERSVHSPSYSDVLDDILDTSTNDQDAWPVTAVAFTDPAISAPSSSSSEKRAAVPFLHDKSPVPNKNNNFVPGAPTIAMTDEGYYTMDKTMTGLVPESATDHPNDDTCSIQSDDSIIGPSIPAARRRDLSVRFASEMVDHLATVKVSDDTFENLPQLLLDYSKMLHRRARPGVEKHASTFIMDHARDKMRSESRTDTRPEKYDILSWTTNISGTGGEAADVPADVADVQELVQYEPSADIESARLFLCRGTEFRWLIDNLQSASHTMKTGPQCDAFRDHLMDLQTHWPRKIEAELEWDLLGFLDEQYPKGSSVELGTVITYCGADGAVEAMSCREYIHRMWPSYGPLMLSCVEQAILNRSGRDAAAQVTSTISPAKIKLHIEANTLQASIESDPVVIIEVVEVLAWLGAACRASPDAEHPMYCSPAVEEGDTAARFRITFNTRNIPSGSSSSAGSLAEGHASNDGVPILPPATTLPESASLSHCWMWLVRNPVVVEGYPVLRRPNGEKGLEIDLGLMTELANAHRVVTFDDLLILNGLCSMLVAVAEDAGSVIWHYILGSVGRPVSLNDAREHCKQAALVNASALPRSRHFVGLTTSSIVLTGTKHANYDIGFTGPNFVSTGYAVKDLTVGFSKMFAMSAKLVPGHKDTRFTHSKAECYELQIGYVKSTRVLFYDVQEDRAWLVNGLDALLHLSRAYLSSPNAEPAEYDLHTHLVEQFQHRDFVKGRWQTAHEVLCNPKNLKIRIGHTYEPDDEASSAGLEGGPQSTTPGMYFKDIVSNFCEIMREIKAHNEDARRRDAEQITTKRPFASKQIVGFGFADIMSKQQTMQPRFAKLKSSGQKWSKVAAQAGAINILGSGFGQLLSLSNSCKKCTEVPTGFSFLATSTELLRRIADERGVVSDDYLQLAKGVFLHRPGRLSRAEQCQCDATAHGIKCDVTVDELQFRPPGAGAIQPEPASTADTLHGGAVVIGRKKDLESARLAMLVMSRSRKACDGCRLRSTVGTSSLQQQSTASSPPHSQTTGSTTLHLSLTQDSGYHTATSSDDHSSNLAAGVPNGLAKDRLRTLTSQTPSRLASSTVETDLSVELG
ncbi:hypothetical protein LTR35_014367 [Friedmanniomyces endolithicus]|nr:hypothetical protein LTR35_014367 [Friedmanniomyces endolithicus]KAK1013380.1 hypothetical protein LTR54_004287 [Friedmanniomyces endolithicus]